MQEPCRSVEMLWRPRKAAKPSGHHGETGTWFPRSGVGTPRSHAGAWERGNTRRPIENRGPLKGGREVIRRARNLSRSITVLVGSGAHLAANRAEQVHEIGPGQYDPDGPPHQSH